MKRWEMHQYSSLLFITKVPSETRMGLLGYILVVPRNINYPFNLSFAVSRRKYFILY